MIENELYRHYKGGLYCKHAEVIAAGAAAANNTITFYNHDGTPQFVNCKLTDDCVVDEILVVYEHIYPHERSYFVRPLRIWNEPLEDGSERFKRVK